MEKGKQIGTISSSLAALVVAANASAGFVPSTPAFVVNSTAGSATVSNTATQLAPGVFAHTGSWSVVGASINWTNNVFAWNDATNSGFLNTNLVIKNETTSNQTFVFYATMAGFGTGSYSLNGSVGGQFMNATPGLGMLQSIGPMWSATVDSTAVNSQLIDRTFFAPPFSGASIGSFNFAQPYSSAITSGVGVRFSLTISAGVEANLTSSFGIQVPAPGALALLGFLPLAGTGRRRR